MSVPPTTPAPWTPGRTLCAAPPAAAAHSLNADIVTSLQQINITGTAIWARDIDSGGSMLISTSTVVTLHEALQHRQGQQEQSAFCV
jgi:hypothetical protein